MTTPINPHTNEPVTDQDKARRDKIRANPLCWKCFHPLSEHKPTGNDYKCIHADAKQKCTCRLDKLK